MDFKLPEIGEGVYEAELVRWLVEPGSRVRMSQPLLEVLTDKATMELPAPFGGTIKELLRQPGDVLKVGEVILRYNPAGAASDEPAPVVENKPVSAVVAEKPAPASPRPTPSSVKASPSVRHMARKLGIDLGTIKGTGPGGRVLLDDLTATLTRAQRPAPAPKQAPALDLGQAGTKQKLVGLRRKIAEHMVRSKRTIPHYSYMDECDVSALVALRASLKDIYAQAGVKLTFLPFFVKAVAAALKDVPLVNASLDEEAGEVVLHDRYDIGIAVATPAGLIVPVVRAADTKDIGTIAREIERLSDEARAGKAKLDDLKGGTFTVTSIGSIGGLISTPVINLPEVGILGIGKVVRRPVYNSRAEIVPADVVYLSFSFDHRVVDGAIGAVFGNAVMERLRNPAALLLPSQV